METAETPAVLAAVVTAAIRSLMLALLASYRMMFALGATAWAHSTSSDSSTSQPPLLLVELAGSVLPPVCPSTVSVGPPLLSNDGRLKVLLKLLASVRILGSL